MKRDVLRQASQYAKAHRRRRRWQKAVTCMAAVVVFCTTYALILPAITMEQDKCDLPEHTHDESCYTLVETDVHVHDESCYTYTEGHTHTEDCYTAQRGELICAEEERPGHQHTDECYTERTELVCETPEGEEHQHTDACYETIRELTCGLEEDAGHAHTDECYAWEQVLTCDEPESEGEAILTCGLEEGDSSAEPVYELTCGLEEHTHSLACYADPEADVESAQIWERTFQNVELTGIPAEDVLAIAKTQLGYRESSDNYIVLEDGETVRGYTRYGAWYGDPYGDWCAMFASFCLHYADVADMPLDAGCQHWIETLSEEHYDLYRTAGEHTPAAGELIFFDLDEEKGADHVGLVAEVIADENGTPVSLKVIEGNSSDKVQCVTYDVNAPAILGYGLLPGQETAPEEEVTLEEETEPAEEFRLTAESENGVAVTVSGTPDALPYPAEEITLDLRPVTDEEIIALWEQTIEEEGLDAEASFLVDISLLHDGEEIEPIGPVQVTFAGLEEQEECPAVFHLDPETEQATDMDAALDDEGDVVLDTDHFSVYGVGPRRARSTKPQPGEYIYLDLTDLGGYYPNEGYTLGFYYNDGTRITDYETVAENLFKIQLQPNTDVDKGINFYRLRNSDSAQSWIPGGTTLQAGKNLFRMTSWTGDNQWTGSWANNWYVETLAGQPLAFENKSGADLTGVKALFYEAAGGSPVSEREIGAVANGANVSFTFPETYGSYVQFVDGDGSILGDSYSNFLATANDQSGSIEDFVYNASTKYCYKYKTDASDSTWGMPGDGVAVTNDGRAGTVRLEDIKEGGVYYLAEDINWTGGSINITGDTTLNLKGQTITTGTNSLFTVASGAEFTITDSIEISEDDPGTPGGDVYGRAASLSDNTLTYYVTESEENGTRTGTSETLVQHTVRFGDCGAIVCSGTGYNVIKVTGGTLNIEGGRISSSGSHVLETSGGTINLSDGLIQGNSNGSAYGSGIYMDGGTLHMTGGYIAGGKGEKGGGIYMNAGTINCSGGVVAANIATNGGYGGGIYMNDGVLNLTGGIVSGNVVWDGGNENGGGGVYAENGTISMTGGYVTNNIKWGGNDDGLGTSGGGGAAFKNAKMYLSGGYITGNWSGLAGGGVYAGFWSGSDSGARFIMTGGTIASNYAQNGEGGGLRIAGGAQGEISAPVGGRAYITNNTTMTTKDWGGGGIFVQTDGTFNIMDVLITENRVNGFGGGVASCPTGDVAAVLDKGAAVFDNHAACTTYRTGTTEKRYDHAFYDQYRNDLGGGNYQYSFDSANDCQDYFCTKQNTIEDTMLGGGSENWGVPQYVNDANRADRASRYSTDYPLAFKISYDGSYNQYVLPLTADPTPEDKASAIAAATVIVSNNFSNTHGGGITTNGGLEMGKTNTAGEDASLTLKATKQVRLATGSYQTSELEYFSFVLLNKKPTWDSGNKQWTYDEADIVTGQSKQNDDDGTVTFDTITYDVAGYYTYYLVEAPVSGVEGAYEQDATLYTVGVMVTSEAYTTESGGVTTKHKDYKIEKVDWKAEVNGTVKGTKEYAPEDPVQTATVTVTSVVGGRTFTNQEVISYQLPETGGAGTALYTIGGLLLMAGAGVLLLYSQIKRRKEGFPSF